MRNESFYKIQDLLYNYPLQNEVACLASWLVFGAIVPADAGMNFYRSIVLAGRHHFLVDHHEQWVTLELAVQIALTPGLAV